MRRVAFSETMATLRFKEKVSGITHTHIQYLPGIHCLSNAWPLIIRLRWCDDLHWRLFVQTSKHGDSSGAA